MANLLVDFTKGFVSSVAPESLSELKNDAETIKDTIMGGARTAQDKYREIRQSQGFKKVTDFFFRRSSDFETGSSLEDSDDDFDAGFNFGGESDSSKKNQTALDYEGMRNIVKGQVSSMYQIAGKQAEASAMTTSEIITTLNTRTSEILSSLGNVNTTLKEISGKLDSMIKLQSGATEAKEKRFSLMDSSGNISLSNFFQAAKSGLADNELFEYASFGASMFGIMKQTFGMSGNKAESAGSIAGMLASFFGDKIKIGTGDNRQTINQLKDAFDEKVHNIINNGLTSLMKQSWFTKIFGNLTKREADKDYSNYISNQYDRKKAIFDNMTRKTIVDIIPAYLRKITAALTGENYFISNDGSLTTDKPNGFRSQLDTTIRSGFDQKHVKSMMKSASSDITQDDVNIAQRALTSVYIQTALRTNIQVNSGEDFAGGGIPELNEQTIDFLVEGDRQKKPRSYWARVIDLIVTQLRMDKTSRDNFSRIVRQGVSDSDRKLIDYAENATQTLDIGKITDDMVKDTVVGYVQRASGTDDRTYKERIQAGEMKKSDIPEGASENDRPSDQALEKARRERIKQAELVGNIGKSFKEISSTTIDYVASIFHLLNRGINVYNVQRQGPFEKMGLKKVGGNESSTTTTTITTTNTPSYTTTVSSGESTEEPKTALEKGVEAAKNLVKNPMGVIQSGWERFNQDLTNAKDYVKNEAELKWNKEMLGGQLRNDETISDQDKAIVDTVLAGLQAAVADGETAEDVGPLMEQISKIENEKVKSRLTNVVQGTLKRSEVKKPAQSKIGKILLWGFGLAKKFIGGIVSKAKTFITTIGKKFLGPLFKSLGKNVQGIGRGAKAIKEGFFGSDESVGLFGRLRGNKSDKAEDTGEKIAPATTAETPQQKQEKQDNADIKQDVKELKKNTKSLLAMKMDELKEKVNNNKAVQWFKNTEFGQGFMSAFEKPKELKEETVADKATKSIDELLNDKNGSGVFGTIIDSITGINKTFEEAISKLTNPTPEAPGSTGGEVITTGTEQTAGGESTDTAPVSTDVPSTPATGGADAGGGAANAGGAAAAAGGKTKGVGFDIGKILGGVFSIGGNLIAMIVKVITSLKAFKAMMAMFNKALTKILKPLNKAFKAITKALKPVLKTVTKVLKQIVEYVVEIVESVIKIIQPILEAIGPLIEQIFKVLEPLLKIITDVVNVILAPLMGILNHVLVPVINGIAATLNIVSGVIEIGFGLVLTVLGGIFTVVGGIKKFLTFGFADSQYKMGKQMMQTGTQLVSDGKNKLKEGLNSFANVFSNVSTDVEDDGIDQYRGKAAKREQLETTSPMDGLYGSGDVSLDSVYGGYGAQGRYGNFMNMTARGCGPIALADAYARRSGGAVSATGLTSAMASSGTYSPSMGTSVTGFMNTASSMGMNLTAGGVTPASLKQASPRNPITVIGSGADFSTRSGNNHYMNVIGSSGGTAFVSNPLSGRIERRPISGLASSSVVGLYGSGNVPAGNLRNVYGSGDMTEAFSEAISDTLSSLKDLVGGIVSMFTGDSDTEAAVRKEEQKKQYEQAMMNQGLEGLDEAEAKFKSKVFAPGESGKSLIELAVTRRSGESDADYQKRLNREYERNKIKYLTLAMNADLKEKAKLAAGDGEGTLGGVLKNAVGDEFVEAMDEMWQNVSNAQTLEDLFRKYSSGYVGEDWEYKSGFYSDDGSPLYMDRYTPTVFNNDDAVNWNYPDGNVAPNIPLMEWFKHNVPGVEGISGAYAKYGPPADKLMQGSTGDTHTGADFFGPKGTKFISPVYGTVVANWDETASGTRGNTLVIRDWGNAFHMFSHLDTPSTLPVGTDVYGGDELGYIGQSGTAKYPHLHWQIQSKEDSSGVVYNPFTFFNYYELEEAKKELGGESGAEAAAEAEKPKGFDNFTEWMKKDNFTQHLAEFEGSKFHDMAVKAGLTPQQEAYIASVALQVDGGQRLFGGDVSLVKNGRFGLADWQTLKPNDSHDTSYGMTIQDQMTLGFIRNYFQNKPTSTRAYVSNVDRYGKALATAMGYDLKKGEGTQWGTYLNEDLLEGTGHGIGTAVLSDWNATYEQQLPLYGAYLGDAARYYNWMIDKGYITGEGSGKTSLGEVVDTSAVLDASAAMNGDKRILTQDLINKWNDIYEQYYAATDIYYDSEGNLLEDWSDDNFTTAAESSAKGDSSKGVPSMYSVYYDPKLPKYDKNRTIPSSVLNSGTYAIEAWKKENILDPPYGEIGTAKNKDGKFLYDYILLDEYLFNSAITYDSKIRDKIVAALKKFGDSPSYNTKTSDGKTFGYYFPALADSSRLRHVVYYAQDVYQFINKKTMSIDANAYLYGAGATYTTKQAGTFTNKAVATKFEESSNIQTTSSGEPIDIMSAPFTGTYNETEYLKSVKISKIASLYTGNNIGVIANNEALNLINTKLKQNYGNNFIAAINGGDGSISIIYRDSAVAIPLGVVNTNSDGTKLTIQQDSQGLEKYTLYQTFLKKHMSNNNTTSNDWSAGGGGSHWDSGTTTNQATNQFASMSDAEYEKFRTTMASFGKEMGLSINLPSDKNAMIALANVNNIVDSSGLFSSFTSPNIKLGVSNDAYMRLYGSGDESAQIIPTGLNQSITSQVNDLFTTDGLANNSVGGAIINTYNVSQSSTDIMDRLANTTFNVRSETMETLLNGMLTLMRERRQKASTQTQKTIPTRSRNQNRDGIFTDEAIPRQIQRLSVG